MLLLIIPLITKFKKYDLFEKVTLFKFIYKKTVVLRRSQQNV